MKADDDDDADDDSGQWTLHIFYFRLKANADNIIKRWRYRSEYNFLIVILFYNFNAPISIINIIAASSIN